MKSGTLRIALVFVLGVVAGVAVPWPRLHVSFSRGATSEAQPVKGVEGPLPHAAPWGRAVTDISSPEPSATAGSSHAGAHEPPSAQRPSRAERPARSDVARAALNSTVFIQVDEDAYGAGVLLDDQGHILTCHHIVEGTENIRVFFADGERHAATLLDADAALDVALLRVGTTRATAFEAASVASVEPGDELFAMGAPRRMRFTFSRGMASFIGRPFDDVYYLQTDLALNGGSSGGPVMDRRGRVVAISSFVLRDTEGLAFALPIDYAMQRFAGWLGAVAGPASEGLDVDAFERWQAAAHAAHVTTE